MLGILKIIILFLIIVVSTLMGIAKAKSYESRVVELKKIKNGFEVLRSKIEFTYEPIKDIFFEISKIIYDDKENIFNRSAGLFEKKSVSDSWNIAIDGNINLDNEDKETLKMFGKLLGKTDKSGQINEIDVTSKLLDSLIEKSEQEKNKNYKLFKSLGTIVGIGICIVLF